MQYLKSLFLIIGILVFAPALLSARQNSLTVGLGASFDYSERVYDTSVDDPDTEIDESELPRDGEDDDKFFFVTPLIHFTSTDVRDNFEIRIAPDIKYDLIEYDTNWDSDFFVSADRYMTRTWQLEASNSYIVGDYYRTDDVYDITVPGSAVGDIADTTIGTLDSDPEISPNIGRRRFWRNTLNLGSNHTYKEDSLFGVGFDYIVLRNDDDSSFGVEDYDRYGLSFLNEHQFSNIWSSMVEFLFVQGDFEETDREVVDRVIGEIAPGSDIVIDDSDLSRDLQEYHLQLAVENLAIAHNPLSLAYNYTSTNYDETLRNDVDIHQATFIWRHDYSQHAYTRLGVGPSYEETENRDDNWDWNGIAEFNYLIQNGSLRLNLDKGYTVDNFSGDAERGFVDFWDASLTGNYNVSQYLSLRAELGYLFEDREDPLVLVSRLAVSGDQLENLGEDDIVELEQYETERFRAGMGGSYNFWRNFTASVDYFYIKQDTERFNDDYDDHRILFTISWSKEMYRW